MVFHCMGKTGDRYLYVLSTEHAVFHYNQVSGEGVTHTQTFEHR